MTFSKAYLVFATILVIICSPRFNRRDIGISRWTTSSLGDSIQYTRMVDYYRGEGEAGNVHVPFSYRPLVPYLASLLPFKSNTSVNAVNVTSLCVALFFLMKLLKKETMSLSLTALGAALFVISFPTFYYGAIGYTDPVIIAFFMVSLFIIRHEHLWLLLPATIFIGTFVKETSVISIPVLLTQSFIVDKKHLKGAMVALWCFVFYFLATHICRSISVDQRVYIWSPSLEELCENVFRFRTWASFVLTYGIPGVSSTILVIACLISHRRKTIYSQSPYLVGMLSSIALFFYAMLSAYSDGRFIWPSVIFSIPLFVCLIQKGRRQGR